MILNRFCNLGAVFLALSSCAFAQLTWDPALDAGATGGPGTWDDTTANWWNGASDVAWIDSEDAVFGGTGGLVTIGTGSTIIVNNLTLNPGVGVYTFSAQTDNEGISVDPGAIWTLNDNELEFVGDQLNDTKLTMSSAGTLTVTGSGTFDTGERQNDADWVVAGSTLDVQGTMTVRGHPGTVGQFATVKLADGTSYIHERNVDQAYVNNWDITGTVNFDNQFGGRSMFLTGLVGGTGTLEVTVNTNTGGAGTVRLDNVGNTFSGGVVVDGTNNYSQLQVYSGDGSLGAVPASLDPDNVRLINGGALELLVIETDANRGITLEGGGTLLAAGTNTINGPITGTGDLQIGVDQDGNGGFMILAGLNDYDGETNIRRGNLVLGADGALPAETFVRIGGNGTSRLVLNGKTQTIVGLGTAGNNTRQLVNHTAATGGPTAGTITINVPDGVNRVFGSAFGVNETNDNGNLNLVKTGLGRQELGNVRISGSVTVTEGELQVGNNGGISAIGSASVTGATLVLSDNMNAIPGALVVNDGSSLSVLVNETNESLSVDTATFGPDGTATIALDYGALTTGNPSYPGINVTSFDGFDPSAVDIDISVSGSGFAVGQFPLIQYSATSPLANIDNFNLVGLPEGAIGTLVNNTGSQSIDLNITEAVRSLRWFGGSPDADWETVDGWDLLPGDTYATYVNFYPGLGAGDSVLFDDYEGASESVVLSSTLTPQSVTVNNTSAGEGSIPTYTFSGTGKLSGTMGLIKSSNGSLVIANSGGNDYTGGTIINSGDLILGVDDALPTDGLLVVGGTGTSRLLLSGFNQTVSGLDVLGGNTRQILNTADTGAPVGPAPTLTVNVPLGEEYDALYTIGLDETTDQGNFNITKSGDGIQNLGQLHIGGDLSVTGGTLQVGFPTQIADAGAATVSAGGNLRIWHLGINLTAFTVDAGATAEILWNVTDWTGAGGPGVDWPRINTTGDFTVTDDASFTIVIDDSAISGFTEANTSFIIGSAGGTVNATNAKFTVDQTGFTAGAGTFSVSVSGSDIILSYTTGGVDPYTVWSGGADFDVDTNGDGVDNGLAFLLGAADVNANAIDLLPTSTQSGGDLVMTFSMLNAAARGSSGLGVQHSSDLGITDPWSTAATVPEASGSVDGVSFIVTADGDMNDVTATIPSSEAVDGKLFGRVSGSHP